MSVVGNARNEKRRLNVITNVREKLTAIHNITARNLQIYRDYRKPNIVHNRTRAMPIMATN